MREIKFRAWDGEQMFQATEIWLQENFIQGSNSYRTELAWLPATKSSNILMQYTGLKDKNGKEIYEGDIVKGVVKQIQLLTSDTDENCNTNMGGYVYYDYNSFILKVIENLCDEGRYGMCNYFDFMSVDDVDFCDMEVIGNIYENKDLLS